MKLLTANEIKFLKETGWTPTVTSCNEWKRCTFTEDQEDEVMKSYGIDAEAFRFMIFDDNAIDCISLAEEAAYILSVFFTWSELFQMMRDKTVLKWLQDWRYFCGYRKWDEGEAYIAAGVAMDIVGGCKKVITDEDGYIWIVDREDQYALFFYK